jgi:N-acetylmuramoyl-L-alanine amidase
MSSKNTSIPKLLLWAMTALGVCTANSVCLAEQFKAPILFTYPKSGQTVRAVDSTFVLGRIPRIPAVPGSPFGYEIPPDLYINGQPVEMFSLLSGLSASFLAFLPVTPGEFVFRAELYRGDPDLTEPLATGSLMVQIPPPLISMPRDSLAIAGDYRPPGGDQVLATGDRLRVQFQATPGLWAWFSIPGLIDSVPMTEIEPQQQAYWGEAVFGAGAVPDSLMISGIYSGYYIVPESVSVIDTPVVYHIAPPGKAELVGCLFAGVDDSTRAQIMTWLGMPSSDSSLSLYSVSLNHPDYPQAFRFIDSVQTIRHDPRKGYFAIFQPSGIIAMAVGAEGDWYRLELAPGQYAWAAKESVELLPKGTMPPRTHLTVVRTYGADDRVKIEFPLSGKHPFRVIEESERKIRLILFGVTSDTDWIRYDFSDSLIAFAQWNQPSPGVYELTIETTKDIWGYDTYYIGNSFYLQLNKAPKKTRSLKGKTIVVDPGHSSDPGSIGPSGFTEAEANLGISLLLRDELRKKGATVIMTREDTSHVDLYDRPSIAKANDADLFVSVHNNALPDGVNPFTNNGVSSYYYHRHSFDLAGAIQRRLLKATGLKDFGLFHGNLAVQRPTHYPAVLLECGFMILPEQEALLKTERYRKKVAKAIRQGIEDFLRSYSDGR